MKDLILRIPGKSFLAGEYLALQGGPTLVAATKPGFEIRVRQKSAADLKKSELALPFHPDSPAGKFYSGNSNFFSQFCIEWENANLGGFGSSTAEFIALHALYQMRESLWVEQERHLDIHEMLTAYRACASLDGAKWIPSGADLVAQVRGGISFFESKTGKMQSYAWPFEKIGFCLVKTGFKLPTHEHLKTLPDFDGTGLEKATMVMRQAIQELNDADWIQGVRALAQELERLSFVAPSTQELLRKIQSLPVMAAKGCGALGADVIVVYYQKLDEGQVLQELGTLGLTVASTDRELSEGLIFHIDHQALEPVTSENQV
jgi:mevalonate kinase